MSIKSIFTDLATDFDIPYEQLLPYVRRMRHQQETLLKERESKGKENVSLKEKIESRVLESRSRKLENLEKMLSQQVEAKEIDALRFEAKLRILKRKVTSAEKRVCDLQSFIFEDVQSQKPQRDMIWNLHNAKRILILGEEDFSFTKAIARFVGNPNRIVTTAFEENHDISQIKNKFPAYAGVDATKLDATLPPSCDRFDRVFFMFPWPKRYGDRDVISVLRAILIAFLSQVKRKLSQEGMVIIALYSNAQIQGVDLEKLAFEQGFTRISKLPFHQMWGGLRPYGYIPWIPGADEDMMRVRSILFHLFP